MSDAEIKFLERFGVVLNQYSWRSRMADNNTIAIQLVKEAGLYVGSGESSPRQNPVVVAVVMCHKPNQPMTFEAHLALARAVQHFLHHEKEKAMSLSTHDV
jgi:hypothetical protein